MFVGAALSESSKIVIERGKQIASHVLEASASDIEYKAGRFVIAGTDRSIGLLELAARLRSGPKLPEGAPTSLNVDHVVTDPVPSAFPNGCHIAEVEVDPETGATHVVRYSAVNDLGTIVNPLLVEGQIQGGVVQGLGQVLLEQAVYDSDGQLVTGSFMDYAMPRAHDAPMIDVVSHPVPTKSNPLGAKGCGEAGTSGGLPSVANAVIDALSDYGIPSPGNADDALAHLARHPGRQGQASMSQLAEILGRSRSSYVRVVGAVSAAHFVSHYYIILLAPLLPLVRAEYGVSYTEIGLAFAAFNFVSAALQTPAGFLVDRLGARDFWSPASLSAPALSCSPVSSIHSGFWSRCSRSPVLATRSITRPTTLCSRIMYRRIALARHFRFTHLPACSAPPLRRNVAHDAEALGLARRIYRCGSLGFAVAATLLAIRDQVPLP